MSLNGLDADAVVKAHQAAQAEAGAWFLLKYASRDTVELLGSGSGGVAEARSTVESYQEKSPLYGMVHYRRKRVVLKYVPEGISRLLQVRLTVQFQSVTDSLIPHDHIFTFAAASELTESALGLATMQLQAGGSLTSSTSSLRGRRLDEIAEDSEDTSTQVALTENPAKARSSVVSPTQKDDVSQPLVLTSPEETIFPAQGQSAALSDSKALASGTVEETDSSDKKTTVAPQAEMSIAHSPTSPSAPLRVNTSLPRRPSDVEDDGARPSIDPLELSLHASPRGRPGDSQQSMDLARDHEPFSRYLAEAESSSISRWTDDVLASTLVKPKQKRAPRPHVESGRPKTSGTSEDSSSSKRANLPNSIRVSTRPPSGQSTRPGSQQSSRSVPVKFVPSQTLPPPLPSPRFDIVPALPQIEKGRPAPSVASSAAFDGPAPSPEKLRLMKALQMRKRAQLRANRPSAPTPSGHAPVSSIGSSISAMSSVSAGQMSEVSALTEAQTLTAEPVTAIESSTTSPTSVITISEDQSTKPSSVSEMSSQHDYKSSLSSGSNSSTTPKAEAPRSGEYNPSNTPAKVQTDIDHDVPANNFLASLSRSAGLQPKPLTSSADNEVLSPRKDRADEGRGRRKPDLTLQPSASGYSTSPSRKRYKMQSGFGGAVSDLSDSESFMEELQNATLQEAKPISVARSPVTPVLSRHADRPQSSRAPTSETRDSSKSPATTPEGRRAASRAGSTRSISTALPQWPPPGNEPPVPALPKQKINVSSGISKRVKAFEGMKNKELPSTTGSSALLTPSRASTFSTILKRTSFFSQNQTAPPTPDKAFGGSSTPGLKPEAGQSMEENLSSRPWIQRPGSSTEVLSPSHKNETVTITARIVRDEQRPKTSIPAPNEAVLNLRRSPLIIEHDTADRYAARPQALTAVSAEAVYKRPSSRSRRFSFTSLKSNTFPQSPIDASNRLSSQSSQKRTSKTISETSSIAEDKRASRTSRLMKRISGIGGRKHKAESVVTPTNEWFIQPDTIHERSESAGDKLSGLQVVDIGEVNVQFPETLLWKRRFLRVDDQGHILFAPPSNDFHNSGKGRKYHLADFRSPALPDVESQEMAWSIILALKDGRRIQVACESKHAQRKFLKLLLDAHNAYTQLYGD